MKASLINFTLLLALPALVALLAGNEFSLPRTLKLAVVAVGLSIGLFLCLAVAIRDIGKHEMSLDKAEASIARRRTANDLAKGLGEPIPYPEVERRGY